MRTVYEIWQKDTPAALYQLVGTYPEERTAKIAADVPLDKGWRQVENHLIPEGASTDVFISVERAPDTTEDRAELALDLIRKFGGIDGDHHKAWVLDQVARLLTGDGYKTYVAAARGGEDGPETYEWDEGIAP